MKYRTVMALLAAAVVSTACGSDEVEQVAHEDIPVLEQEETVSEGVPEEASFGERASSGSAGSVLDNMAASFGQPEGGSDGTDGESR